MKFTELSKERKEVGYIMINLYNRAVMNLKDQSIIGNYIIKEQDLKNLDIQDSVFKDAKRIIESLKEYSYFIYNKQPDNLSVFYSFISDKWKKFLPKEFETNPEPWHYEEKVKKKYEGVMRQITSFEQGLLRKEFLTLPTNMTQDDLERFEKKLDRISKKLGLVENPDVHILKTRLEMWDI